MNKVVFKGTATALITPFCNTGVDFDALNRLFDDQLASGVNAVVALGTTGEPATLSLDEKEAIVALAVKKLKGKIPVIVGCGSNSTLLACEACKRAEDMGADAVLAVTPYYNKCTQDGLVRHYGEMSKSTRLPIICYNVPPRTGVNMLPSTFKKLTDEFENVAAIKEASGNMEQIEECIRLVKGRAAVYSGDDSLTVPIMAMGGDGVISVLSNVLPRETTKMTSLCLDGDYKSAAKAQLALLPLVKALFAEVNPIPVKYAAMLKGYGDGTLRLPLTYIEQKNAAALKALLTEFLKINP